MLLDYLGDGCHVEALSPEEIIIYPEPSDRQDLDAATGRRTLSRVPPTTPARRYLWQGGRWAVAPSGRPIEPWTFDDELREQLSVPSFELTRLYQFSPGVIFASGTVVQGPSSHSVLLSNQPTLAVARDVDAPPDPPPTPNARGPVLQ